MAPPASAPASEPAGTRRAQALLTFDSVAGLSVGIFMLALARVLAPWYQVKPELLQFLGVVNLLYSMGSGTLAWRARRGQVPRQLWIHLLVIANLTWTVVCAALVFWLRELAGPLALAHLTLEGAFVAVLAMFERRWVLPWARP